MAKSYGKTPAKAAKAPARKGGDHGQKPPTPATPIRQRKQMAMAGGGR